ncbi:hypothetical protein F4V91_08115 [Neorhizobium galegae]|uniref:Uncharacterized protein n=1 Tax=Neorhizobium galegae TaxID=399 RepID=A0A6A1TPI9_NEOGA|nr:hypothetical protein [Neorhizobium galegae]KAB1086399.1 hypothetical protein F4V91_08115 [Neorhizobium galegae]CDZ43061.1 Hypothetical protein NGAL_HAMBI1146_58340 [Neorhizobium galegae bv. officinalis]
MQVIRDAQTLIGMLESGELNQEMSTKLSETLEKLLELSDDRPNVTYKGGVSLKLNLSVKNGMVEINAEIPPPTLPKLPRKSTVYWLIEGGQLSTEHPQQHDMFGGPREIDHSRRSPSQ